MSTKGIIFFLHTKCSSYKMDTCIVCIKHNAYCILTRKVVVFMHTALYLQVINIMSDGKINPGQAFMTKTDVPTNDGH